jgi:predicted transcriptional regulator
MTKLLDEAVEKLRMLPEREQDAAAQAMLTFANRNGPRFQPTPEQVADIEEGLAQAERGEFASDEEVAAFWRKCRLLET